MAVTGAEMLAGMRAWVTAEDDTRYDQLAEGHVRVDVTHSHLQQRWHDIKLDVDMNVQELKAKLYRHGGGSGGDVDLYLRKGNGEAVYLYDDYKSLRQYGCESGMEIHIKDNNPHSLAATGWLENVNLVEKYKMSDEDYDKREKTVRKHVAKMRETDPNYTMLMPGQGEKPKAVEEERPPTPTNAASWKSQRCEVFPGGRRGEVMYVGPLKGPRPGTWVGVKLDEPMGKCDGTHNGEKYFECIDKYGVFVRPEKVTVGDFPPEDPFALLESDDEL